MAGLSESAKENVLRQVALFSELDEEGLRELSRHAIEHRADRGRAIIEEGDKADCVIVVTSGAAKVVIAGQRGREIILSVIERLGVAGEIGLLDGFPRSATVRALEATTYLRIDAAPFLACLGTSPSFAATMARHVASTVRQTNDQLRVLFTLPANQRVAWCLRRLARQRGEQRQSGAIVLDRHLLHRDIADMTACSRETVTRALRRLEQKNCVTHDGQRLLLHEKAINRYLQDWPWLAEDTV